MRRKVILNGPSSLCISLPAGWIKKNNIQKGAELDIDENDNKIVVSNVNNSDNLKETEVNFEKMDFETQKDIILSLHRKGFDEIKIMMSEEKMVKKIYKFLDSSHLGYEIISQAKNHFVLRNVSIPEAEQFSNLFDRVFRLTLQYAEKINKTLQVKEFVTETTMIHAKSIDKISNYCRRIIIKEDMKNGVFYYSMIDSLVLISSILNEIHNEICDDKQASKELIRIFSEVYENFYRTFSLFKAFSFDEYSRLKKSSSTVDESIQKYKKEEEYSIFIEHIENMNKSVQKIQSTILSICN